MYNKILDSVAMPRQWNNQENVNTWVTHHGNIQRGNIQANGIFRDLPKSNEYRPLFKTRKKGDSEFTRGGMAGAKPITPPSSAHQIHGKVTAKILHTVFCKIINRRKQDSEIFKKYWGHLHGKRYMCMNHILEKCRNPNCSFYHAKAKKMDAQYASKVCLVIAPGIDYIWRHGAADIQIPYPVGGKRKM